MNQKAFFIIFKGLPLKQIKINFLEGESPVLNLKAMNKHRCFPVNIAIYSRQVCHRSYICTTF